MKLTKKIQTETEVIDKIVCDKCGLRIDPEDFVEYQEFITVRVEGGYGSIFGDGSILECDLCQQCTKLLLGDYLINVQ